MPDMCGRASTTTPLEQIAKLVGAKPPYPPWRPRYNQPPGEFIAIALQQGRERRLEPVLWGLSAKDSNRRYVNATAERLAAARSFTRQRGLFFVDGFYEWDRKTKQPFYIYARNRHPIPLAVVYRRDPKGTSCAVVTTTPNELVARVHNRMPAVIPDKAWDLWLDDEVTDSQALRDVLQPARADWFAMHPAPLTVNTPTNDRPELIEPDPAFRERQKARIAKVFERKEFTTADVADELGIDSSEAEELLNDMPGIDKRLAKWWFRKATR